MCRRSDPAAMSDVAELLATVRDVRDWGAPGASSGHAALRRLAAVVQSGEARDAEYGSAVLGALCDALHIVALAPVATAAAGLLPAAGAAPPDARRLMAFVFNAVAALPEVDPRAAAAELSDAAVRALTEALAAAQPSEVVQLRTLLHWVYAHDERRRPMVRRFIGEALTSFMVRARRAGSIL